MGRNRRRVYGLVKGSGYIPMYFLAHTGSPYLLLSDNYLFATVGSTG